MDGVTTKAFSSTSTGTQWPARRNHGKKGRPSRLCSSAAASKHLQPHLLHFIKRVLEHIVSVQLVHPAAHVLAQVRLVPSHLLTELACQGVGPIITCKYG
jgi:hypothetical protein